MTVSYSKNHLSHIGLKSGLYKIDDFRLMLLELRQHVFPNLHELNESVAGGNFLKLTYGELNIPNRI
jgi:hypothetical protein